MFEQMFHYQTYRLFLMSLSKCSNCVLNAYMYRNFITKYIFGYLKRSQNISAHIKGTTYISLLTFNIGMYRYLEYKTSKCFPPEISGGKFEIKQCNLDPKCRLAYLEISVYRFNVNCLRGYILVQSTLLQNVLQLRNEKLDLIPNSKHVSIAM